MTLFSWFSRNSIIIILGVFSSARFYFERCVLCVCGLEEIFSDVLDSFLLYGNVVKSAKVRPIKLLSVPKIEFIDLLVIHESLMALVDALHVFVHFFGLFDVKSLAL